MVIDVLGVFAHRILFFIFCFIVSFPVMSLEESSRNGSVYETPEDIILEVKFGRYLLSPSIFAYIMGEELYLPLSEMAEIMKFNINFEIDPVSVTGKRYSPDFSYEIKSSKDSGLALYVDGELTDEWPDNSWLSEYIETDQELYLSSKYFNKFWPISFGFNIRRLRLDVIKNGAVPELDAIIRAVYRNKNLHKQKTDTSQKSSSIPYAAYSPPIINYSYSQNHSKASARSSASVRLKSDILGIGQDLSFIAQGDSFLSNSNVTNIKWTGKYESAVKGDPEPLLKHIKKIEVGDIRKKIDAPNGVGGDGVGLSISTLMDSYSVFEKQRIEGYAESGWDADIYINQGLIGYQKISDDGKYTFDVFLKKGFNLVSVELNSPYGEKRIDTYTFHIKESYIPRGEWGGYYTYIKSGMSVFDKKKQSAESLGLHELTVGYGLGPELDIKWHLILHENKDKESSPYNAMYGWTSSGSITGSNWRWENFFDSGYYHSRFMIDRDIGNGNISFSLDNYPGWPGYDGGHNYKYFEVKGTNSFYFSGRRYTAGLAYSEVFYREKKDRNISSYLRTAINRGSVNSTQACDFIGGDTPTCTVDINLRSKINSVEFNFDTKSKYKDKWLQHDINIYFQSKLNSFISMGSKRRNYSGYLGAKSNGDILEGFLSNVTLSARYGRTYKNNGEGVYSKWLYDSRYSIGASWRKEFKYTNLFLSFKWADGKGFSSSFGFSGSLLPGRDNYSFTGIQANYPAQLFMYHDSQYNGHYDELDSVMEGKFFRQGRSSDNATDKNGLVWMSLSKTGSLGPDLRSMDDPYQVSGIEPYVIPVRSERVTHIDWPIIDTGAIEGVLTRNSETPHMNLRIELYADKNSDYIQTTQSALDGFYVFEFVRPGNYEVRVYKIDGTTVSHYVSISNDDLWPVENIVFD